MTCFQIGLGVQADDDNIRVPILAWATCAYTIAATGTASVLSRLLKIIGHYPK